MKTREYQGVYREWIFDTKTGTHGLLYRHPDGRSAYVHGGAGAKTGFVDGVRLATHTVTEDGIQVGEDLFFPWGSR
jgi:hypothetical protein